MTGLKSRPADPRETAKKIAEALRKRERGERLTEQDETVLYWLFHGGCHACGGVKAAVAARDEGESG